MTSVYEKIMNDSNNDKYRDKLEKLEGDYFNKIKEIDTQIKSMTKRIKYIKSIIRDDTTIPDNVQSLEEHINKCKQRITNSQQKIKEYNAEKTALHRQYMKDYKEIKEQQQQRILLITYKTFVNDHCVQENSKTKERVSNVYEKYFNYCLCNNIQPDNYTPFKKNLSKHFKVYKSNGYITINAKCNYKITPIKTLTDDAENNTSDIQIIERFINKYCVQSSERINIKDLYHIYCEYCKTKNISSEYIQAFSNTLINHGFKRGKSEGCIYYNLKCNYLSN